MNYTVSKHRYYLYLQKEEDTTIIIYVIYVHGGTEELVREFVGAINIRTIRGRTI